jgi:hypothetical protein
MEDLMPAFAELKHIRASVNKEIPLMDRWELYDDLARKLWKSYKELMKKAIVRIPGHVNTDSGAM